MSLSSLKKDFLNLLELKGEISKYNQMLLHYSNMNDKRNFDLEKCEKIKVKINELQEKYNYLYDKWFIDI